MKIENIVSCVTNMCISVYLLQGHPEAGGNTDGPPKEDHDQCPADEGAGAQQECAIGARITPTPGF